MDRKDTHATFSTQDVRAGSEEHVVRYILGISTTMAIAALSTIWISAAVLLA